MTATDLATSTLETRAKARQVRAMFDGIATRYDLLNRVMSAGQDERWRRAAAAALAPLPPGPLLDLGVGTGDLARALRRHHPRRAVAGVDLSTGMLRLARAKAPALALAQGDALALPYRSGSFAGVATAFTLRNVADLDQALAEIDRVLTPGGRFVCLEITRPTGSPLAALFNRYFQGVVPRIGGLISGAGDAYRYLPASVERFVTGEQLAGALVRAGFDDVRLRRFWPGAVTLHAGTKG